MSAHSSTTRPAIIWTGLAIVVILNLALVRQNRHLTSERSSPPPTVAVGDVLPTTIGGLDISSGSYTTVDLGAGRAGAFLIYFSVFCPVCLANEQEFRSLADSAQSTRQVVWITRDPADDVRTFFYGRELEDRVLAELPWRFYNRLTLHTVPQVIMLRADGTVTHAWKGGVSPARKQEVLAAFASERQ